MRRPSRCAERITKGRGQSARPLGPCSIALGSNKRAYAHIERWGQTLAPGQPGAQTNFLKILPNAPQKILLAFPGEKYKVSAARNWNRKTKNSKARGPPPFSADNNARLWISAPISNRHIISLKGNRSYERLPI